MRLLLRCLEDEVLRRNNTQPRKWHAENDVLLPMRIAQGASGVLFGQRQALPSHGFLSLAAFGQERTLALRRLGALHPASEMSAKLLGQ
jgi:hypothetical protein